ncbi:hypothetical protein LA324_05335 [Corynebacterium coyleae]|uniref:hypothetical protein n=1 Tax=Corynebacterium coyleae TaxID=53374 RepID=UPI001CC8F3B2|nr:hypothetical protein [Corynebacterium coyleae]UBI10033.1 hypothetical protein LA324_05335 [Corynebacterium coyleae]
MDNKIIAKDMARGVFRIKHELGYVYDADTDECIEDIYVDNVPAEDYNAVVEDIAKAVEEWLGCVNLPPVDDYRDLAEELALPDPLCVTERYGGEFEELHDTFPSVDLSFWYEGDQLRVELDSIWMTPVED